MAGTKTGARPGRKPKPPRKSYEAKIPLEQARRLEADAKARGQDYVDWIADAVAAKLGEPVPDQQPIPGLR